jgi:hypothetical protein
VIFNLGVEIIMQLAAMPIRQAPGKRHNGISFYFKPTGLPRDRGRVLPGEKEPLPLTGIRTNTHTKPFNSRRC